MLVKRFHAARLALLAVAAALLPGCATGADDPLTADSGWIRIPTQDATTESVRARFERPEGKGPFAAVVVIHPGGGVSRTTLDYGRRLRDWGYAALVIDSYGTRNIRSTGEVGARKGTHYQLADLYGALSWLARRPDIDKQRIAAIGFSRGGQTTLSAIAAEETLPGYLRDGLRRPGKVALGIGIFASCIDVDDLRIEGKLLMLVGDQDRERNVACARELVAKAKAAGFAAEAKVYPGARHDYTSRRGTDDDRTAAEDSLIRTRDFLDKHLK
jgi:dienelactone hydrolase